LDWTLVLGRRHLERVLRIYIRHYNEARRHRGLALQTPMNASAAISDPREANVRRRGRVGRLHPLDRPPPRASSLKVFSARVKAERTAA